MYIELIQSFAVFITESFVWNLIWVTFFQTIYFRLLTLTLILEKHHQLSEVEICRALVPSLPSFMIFEQVETNEKFKKQIIIFLTSLKLRGVEIWSLHLSRSGKQNMHLEPIWIFPYTLWWNLFWGFIFGMNFPTFNLK